MKIAYPFSATAAGYRNLWNKAKVLPHYLPAAGKLADIIGDDTHRPRFAAVEKATNVPWFMVGLLLLREGSLNLARYLGNGQLLTERTTITPKGRGPFATFEAGAIDALTYEGMVGITDWTVPRMLYWMERFNGQGYFGTGVNSPYLWSWTNLYGPPNARGGKFDEDGHFNAALVDQQPGCAAILKVLEQTNADVAAYISPPKQEPPIVTNTPTPSPLPQISLAQIEGAIRAAETFLPIVGTVFPPAAPFVALVPLADELLRAFMAIQGGGNFESILAQALRNAANQLDSMAGKPPTAPTAPTATPPNLVLPSWQPQAPPTIT